MRTIYQGLLVAGLFAAAVLPQNCLAHHEEGHVEPTGLTGLLQDTIMDSVRTNLPTLPPNVPVPTDASSIGGSLGRAQGLDQKLKRPEDKGIVAKPLQVKRDDRYNFTGEWLPLWVDRTVAESHKDPSIAQTDSKARTVVRKEGQIEELVLADKNEAKEAMFMATQKADYLRKSENEIELFSGAILIKTNKKPAYVSLALQGRNIKVQFTGPSISMISLMDEQPLVLNLTDKSRGACSFIIASDKQAQSVKIGPGELAELYPKGTNPSSSAVASKVILNQDVANDLRIQLARYNCIAALRHYNITSNLPKKDKDRIIKTAAALAYTQPIR